MMLINHVSIRRSYSRLLHAILVGLFSVPVWSQVTSDSSAPGIRAAVVSPVAEPAYAENSHSPSAEFAADRPAEEDASNPGQTEYEPADTLGSGSSDDSFLGSRLESAVEVEGQVSSLSSEALRSRPGRTVVLKNVTGSTHGGVWGSGVYTDDSDVATAAVHSGALQDGETADLRVVFLGPRDAFDASTHNGVTSSQYGPWSGSFAFVIAPGPRGRQSDPVALPDSSSWSSHVGETFDIDVVGSSQGTVWGTTVYTDDSPLAVAAVHAGVLDPGQRAKVRVTILPGRDSYEGTSRHGVTSYSYTRWGRSYFVERVPHADPAAAPDAKPVLEPVTEEAAPQSLSGYRSRVGETLRLRLTGEADGWIWGSDVYTDDSSPAAAAVHAGALRVGETGTVKVTILPGRSSYPGSTRNGITSQDWEAFAGSFRIERAKRDRESVDDDQLPR